MFLGHLSDGVDSIMEADIIFLCFSYKIDLCQEYPAKISVVSSAGATMTGVSTLIRCMSMPRFLNDTWQREQPNRNPVPDDSQLDSCPKPEI